MSGDRDVDGGLDVGDEGEVVVFHLVGAAGRVGRHPVDVELDGVGAGVAEQAGVAGPPARRRGVEAGDHRHRDARLGALEVGQVAVDGAREVRDGGEVVERLGEVLGAGFQHRRELDLLVDDLLLEQRGQHDGADAGVGEAGCCVGVAGERPGRGDDR